MEVVPSGAVALRSMSVKKFIVSAALCIAMVAGAAAQPVSATNGSTISVKVGDKVVVLDLAGVQLTIDQVQELIGQITDFILAKEAALVGEVIDLLQVARAILEEVVISFLERLLGSVLGLIITLKLNVEGFVLGVLTTLKSVCVTTNVKADPRLCVVINTN